MPDAPLTDVLSDVLEQVKVQGIETGGFAVRGPWASRGTISRPLKLVALVAGSAEVSADGPGGPDGPVDLGPGDVVLLNHRTRLEVRGGAGDGPETELVPEASFDSMALAAADLASDTVLVGGGSRSTRPGWRCSARRSPAWSTCARPPRRRPGWANSSAASSTRRPVDARARRSRCAKAPSYSCSRCSAPTSTRTNLPSAGSGSSAMSRSRPRCA